MENSQISSEVFENEVKEEVPESNDMDEEGIEFTDVNDMESLTECSESLYEGSLIEDENKVAIDPLDEEEWVPKRVLINCQNEFKKKIRTLQISIVNMARAADEVALKLRADYLEEKLEELRKSLKEKNVELREAHSLKKNLLKTKDCFEGQLSINRNLLAVKDRLDQQLNWSKIENNNLNSSLTTVTQQNKNLNSTLTAVTQQNNTLKNGLKELSLRLEETESKYRKSKMKCSLLAKECFNRNNIDQSAELSKECLDLDAIETWFADMLKSQNRLKKQLTAFNKDFRQLTCEESEISKCRPEKTTHASEKRARRFYSTVWEKLCEDHDTESREIDMELGVLRENVSILRNVLAQKDEQHKLLEEELKIFREELGLKAVKLEDVKDEGEFREDLGLKAVKLEDEGELEINEGIENSSHC